MLVFRFPEWKRCHYQWLLDIGQFSQLLLFRPLRWKVLLREQSIQSVPGGQRTSRKWYSGSLRPAMTVEKSGAGEAKWWCLKYTQHGAHRQVSAMRVKMAAAWAWPTEDLQKILVERGMEDVFLEKNNSRIFDRSYSDILIICFWENRLWIAHVLKSNLDFVFPSWVLSWNVLFSPSVAELNSFNSTCTPVATLGAYIYVPEKAGPPVLVLFTGRVTCFPLKPIHRPLITWQVSPTFVDIWCSNSFPLFSRR